MDGVALAQVVKVVAVYVEPRARSKSSTGTRSADRRNVLVFRRSVFGLDDEDDDSDSIGERNECTDAFSALQDHRDSHQLAGSTQPNDASPQKSSAGSVTVMDDANNQMPSSIAVVSASGNSNMPMESVECVTSPAKSSSMEQDTATMAVAAASPAAKQRPRSLTKGEVPTFYSLSTSPSPPKPSAKVSRAVHRTNKSSASFKTGKTSAASCKKTAASEKSNSGSMDRRLTFVVKKTRAATSEKMLSLGDSALADIEDIMDQDEEILQDVSGCSDQLSNDDDVLTLVPSSADNCNVALVPDSESSSACGILSQNPALSRAIGKEKIITDSSQQLKREDFASQLPAANVTLLTVVDMELTNINTCKSPVLFESVSDDVSPGYLCTASDLTSELKSELLQTDKQSVDESIARKDDYEAVRDKHKEKPLSTRSKARETWKQTIENLNGEDSESNNSSQLLGNVAQEPAVSSRQRRSSRALLKSCKAKTLTEPTVSSAGVKEMERSNNLQGFRSKIPAETKTSSKTVSDEHKSRDDWSSKSAFEPKIVADCEFKDQAVEGLPKKVAAFMTKPGKIVYSTAQRKSTSGEPAMTKSRSKSRSVLPAPAKFRSKQLSAGASDPNDSPSSVFVFYGSPKEDAIVCRPGAMLAARKKYISMDDSTIVSEPAEKPPVVRQRSLSASDSAVSLSPHGIMLVLHNGKRTKPRTARSKSVRYGTSETLSTPHAQRKNMYVSLTPYSKGAEHTSSASADVVTVDYVPESPVFISTSPVQQRVTQNVCQSEVIADIRLDNDRPPTAQDNADLNKVF